MQDYVGYRTKKRLEQKKRHKRLWRWLVALAVVALVFILLGAVIGVYPFDSAWDRTYSGLSWAGRKLKAAWPFKSRPKPIASEWLPEGKNGANYLLAFTKQLGGAPVLTTLALASYDSETGAGGLVFFPADLLVNVPGLGMDQLSSLVELDESRVAMTLVTVQNLLGVEIDRYVLGSDRDIRSILGSLSESWPVAVASKTEYEDPSLEEDVDLRAGPQELTPGVAASYITYIEPGREIDLCKRQEAFARTFFDFSARRYDEIPGITAESASLLDTDAADKEISGIWRTFASVGSKLDIGILPVKEFKFESTVVHRVDQEALPAFVKKYVKTGSTKTTAKRYKVEILNGNGVPGIGESVAGRLDMEMFQVVNSANADNFEHPDTVILAYKDDPDTVHAAELVKNALEVGRIEFRPRTQDISDLTIIVGKDYAQK